MADNMIERVARAIGEEMLKLSENYEGPLDPMVPAKKLACAALQAMRTPTAAMVLSGADESYNVEWSKRIYSAYIRAALNEDGND